MHYALFWNQSQYIRKQGTAFGEHGQWFDLERLPQRGPPNYAAYDRYLKIH